jgi:hypothetical protein
MTSRESAREYLAKTDPALLQAIDIAEQNTRRARAYAYCANEMWAGYPCGVEGCPHCGGDVEATKQWVDQQMQRYDNHKENANDDLPGPD